MMQTELTVDVLQAKSTGNENSDGGSMPMHHNQNLNHIARERTRTRTSAKEAVSSRWESRAKASAAKRNGIMSPLVESDSGTATAGSTGSGNSPLNRGDQEQGHSHPHANSTGANSNLHPICQTWRNVQNAIGWRLLHHLEKEQKLHAAPKLNNPQHKKKKPPKQMNKNKKNKSVGGSTSVDTSSSITTTTLTHPQHPMHMSQDSINREKNRHRNREELAETIANLQATTALQNQLSDITNGESKHYLKSVLSILPAAYGFDERSALNSTIVLQNRKRAFLLLDLGRVIRAHAQFITMTCGFESRALNARNSGGNASGLGSGLDMNLPPTHKLRRTGMNVNNVARTRRGVYIQPQFQVTKNPSMELLKLFTRLGVDLRCNSSDDVLAASQAVAEERRERHGSINEDVENAESSMHSVYGEEVMPLVDDVSKTRKPNGYFRRLLQARNAHTACDTSHVEVAVDGADEVQRISNTVRTFAQRRCMMRKDNGEVEPANGSGQEHNGCRFLLRLPSVSIGKKSTDEDCEVKLNDGAWERLVLSVHEAAMKENGELVGVSVDLTPWSNSLSSKEGMVEDSRTVIKDICTHLRLFRLLMLSVGQYHIRVDLTGLPYPLTREHCQVLTQTLKETVCCNVTVEELQQLQVSSKARDCNSPPHPPLPCSDEWDDSRPSTPSLDQIEGIASMANNPSTCSLVFTADISHQLVARAGALCTRIIGVKAAKGVQHDESKTSKCNEEEDVDTAGAVAKHYYIDDGCYGSLGSSKCGSESCGSGSGSGSGLKHIPVPMYGNRPLVKSLFRSLQTIKHVVSSPQSQPSSSSVSPYYSSSPAVSTPTRAISPSADSSSISSSDLTLGQGTSPSTSTSTGQLIIHDKKCADEMKMMSNTNAAANTNTTTNSNANSNTNTNAITSDASESCKHVKSTVWGPTCDGLDKVCESVLLPNDLKSNRDWLVFSNLGCGGFGGGLGLGTAFNGFDPPDVAYCVLGYFSGASGSL